MHDIFVIFLLGEVFEDFQRFFLECFHESSKGLCSLVSRSFKVVEEENDKGEVGVGGFGAEFEVNAEFGEIFEYVSEKHVCGGY